MPFQLNFQLDAASVQKINSAAQTITLVKSVRSSVMSAQSSSDLLVAWLTFRPLMYDTVTWIDAYGLYATTQALQAGATIRMTSVSEGTIQRGWLYTFENGVFNGQSGSGTTFNVQDGDSSYPMLTFGLAQQATVNGQIVYAPLNGVPALYNQQASFWPLEALSIFLSSYDDNGVVISRIPGSALVVELTAQNPAANIGFNSADNTFYLESG